MAIIIPSKNIYGNQNPKVRDNVIERIEVGAVEVVPDNEYEVTIHNERIPIRVESVNQSEGMSNATIQNIAGYLPVVAAGSRIYDNYCTITIKVKKEKANSYVSKIYTGKKSNSKENYIQISKKFNQIAYYYQSDNAYTVTGDFTDTDKYGGYFNFNIIAYDDTVVKEKLFEKNISSIQNIRVVFNLKDTDMENGFVDKFETPTITEDNNYNVYTINDSQMGTDYKPAINAYQNLSSLETDLGGKLNIKEDNDYYTISGLKIFVGRTTYSVASSLYAPTPFSPPLSYPAKVVEVQQNVLQAEITVYGDTIGIDLTDKTVYINGETAKKVHSVDGNELMQTSNYFSYNGENAIESMFEITQGKYKQGKETATIRCSISDYYNYEDKSIAINSNKKNIISYPYLFGEKQTFHGITATHLGGGAILLQGTNTLGDYLFIDLMNKKIEEIVEDFVATSANNPNTKYGYTISMGQYPNSDYNGIAIGYTVNNNITWLRIDPYKEINITIYPMLNKGGKIAFEDPVTPMCFSIGDKVIPMVYGADGKDRPMSTYQHGSQKIFQVLGTKIYYDGAVWQELSLQEV